MAKIPNTKLKQILKKAKDKKDLIERLTSYDPDYVITNLTNIERLADIHFADNDKKKKKEFKIKEKKQTKYQKFIQDNFQDMRKKYESNGETMKAIAAMWKTSSENPKNGSGFVENI
ncbi:13746_t:CDS:1 [Ambispora leptoticha]|uniref:13746_t:CDS:1 n=1 Tax=Ambispora leptoticha TaxID=144679 RepID=A0A9N9AGJ0_9GLOM|nr:13746_t:CDS:1 [Ambispora leptoticha]